MEMLVCFLQSFYDAAKPPCEQGSTLKTFCRGFDRLQPVPDCNSSSASEQLHDLPHAQCSQLTYDDTPDRRCERAGRPYGQSGLLAMSPAACEGSATTAKGDGERGDTANCSARSASEQLHLCEGLLLGEREPVRTREWGTKRIDVRTASEGGQTDTICGERDGT